jgi:hypothetical protein
MDRYIPITWPDIQDIQELDGFIENSHLINDDFGLDVFGSSAYFVKESWYNNKIINKDGYSKP